MRLTVLGGCGAWPAADRACSGYLVEHDGFRLLLDPGYATLPRLLTMMAAADVDAVFVSHEHPDHCADINPLLRARAWSEPPAPPLPIYALSGALDAVLALDRPGLLAGAHEQVELTAGREVEVGPLRAETRHLPHSVPNIGVRLTGGGRTLAYTGDSGPSDEVVRLARGSDVLLAEASYADRAPDDVRRHLCTARDAARQARAADISRLVLTHLLPRTDAEAAESVARTEYEGDLAIAAPGLVVDLS
jgi:ribonuclease BN (tRNA processing enzyme)